MIWNRPSYSTVYAPASAAGVLVSGLVCGDGRPPPLSRSEARSSVPIACSAEGSNLFGTMGVV